MLRKKVHHCWWIVISCCIVMACGLGLLFNCAGIFLVPVSEALGVGRGPVSFYLTIMNLTMTLVLPLAGRTLSKKRIERILFIAYVINYAAFASLALANSIVHFYIAGVLIGFCGAFSLIMPVPVLINNWFEKKLGVVMGTVLAFSGIGGVIFNLIGGFIIENFGWRTGYLALSAIGAALVLPCTLFIIRTKPEDMGLRPYGAEGDNPRAAVPSPEKPNLPASGYSIRVIFKTLPVFAAFAFTCTITLAGAIQNHIPSYGISLGFTQSTGAMAVSFLMVGIIVCKIGIGYLHDRFGVIVAIISGVTAGTLGAILLLFAGSGKLIFFGGAFLFGIIPALTVVAPPLLVKNIVIAEDYNYVLSYVNMGNTFSCAIGLSLYGFIYDLTQSYLACFLIIFVMIVLSYVTCLLTKCEKKISVNLS